MRFADDEGRTGRARFALFVALTVNVVGQSFLFVVLPALGRQMGFTDIATGAILSVSALLLILAAPAWGHLSERIGRRPVIVTALAGSGLAPLAYALVTSLRLGQALGAGAAFVLLFAARAFQALFVGGLLPSVQAYMADVTTSEQRAGGMGLIGAAYGLGAIGGAALAWRVGEAGPASAFLFTTVLVAGGLVLVLLFASEPRRRGPHHGAGIAPRGRVWPFVGITAMAFLSYGMVQQVISLRLQDTMGFSPEVSISKAGIGLLVTASALVIVQGVVVRLIAWPPERLLLAGALLGAGSMVLCGLARSYAETLAILVLFGIALGLLLPGNLASLSLRAGSDAQGKAAGFNMMGQGFGLAAGPLTGAALHHVSPVLPFAAAAILLTAAAVLALCAQRRGRKDQTSQAAIEGK